MAEVAEAGDFLLPAGSAVYFALQAFPLRKVPLLLLLVGGTGITPGGAIGTYLVPWMETQVDQVQEKLLEQKPLLCLSGPLETDFRL